MAQKGGGFVCHIFGGSVCHIFCRNHFIVSSLVGRLRESIREGTLASATRRFTVGTKIIADPGECFQELISGKSLILLRDRPCLEIIIASSNFQASFFLLDELLESV